ncbi:MAG: alanine dehydrogenase [Erysipelotrichaceae bacterium]|nr:alanine dehydrogenase [Erysipelotrichaceae bacterium]
MKVGTIKEIKQHEYRVGITPDNALSYINAGHEVYVEKGAGLGAGFSDEEYIAAGATVLDTAKEVADKVEMLVKVKEPLPEEFDLLKEGMILYTYLHLAAEKRLAKELKDRKVSAVAYETIEEKDGLPCLRPMSEIAGRLSIQEGAKYIESSYGGRGILLGGVPGVERGKVVIIGGGIAGTYAAKAAIGMGAQVTVLDINLQRLTYLDDIFGTGVTTLYSSEKNIIKAISEADLVIGAVLIPGASTPKLIKKEYLKYMKKGAVIVDIAVDQGGCVETTHVTYHDDPIYIVDGILHYCVGNMPGAVPRTSSIALTNATLRYGLMIANKGLKQAAVDSPAIAKGINYYGGKCTNYNVATSLDEEYFEPLESLGV